MFSVIIPTASIITGDVLAGLQTLPDASVHCCVTSPPYFNLRNYQHEGQIGLEPTPDAYVAKMVAVFREVRRVLRNDGTLWLNLGDSYAGGAGGRGDVGNVIAGTQTRTKPVGAKRLPIPVGNVKPKDLLGIPWRVAFALQADGWYLRQDIIWHKPNPMPESVKDRCTKAHEYVFLMSKSARYFYDVEAMKEPAAYPKDGVRVATPKNAAMGLKPTRSYGALSNNGKRNRRSVWTVATRPYKGAHFAVMPPKLVELCILAGCPEGGTVLDPFAGSGTVLAVAVANNRNGLGIELNPAYVTLAQERIDVELAKRKCEPKSLFAGVAT